MKIFTIRDFGFWLSDDGTNIQFTFNDEQCNGRLFSNNDGKVILSSSAFNHFQVLGTLDSSIRELEESGISNLKKNDSTFYKASKGDLLKFKNKIFRLVISRIDSLIFLSAVLTLKEVELIKESDEIPSKFGVVELISDFDSLVKESFFEIIESNLI